MVKTNIIRNIIKTYHEPNNGINIAKHDKLNNILKGLFRKLSNNIVDNETYTPTIINTFVQNTKFKPFWNDKIQKITDKLYKPPFDAIYENNIKTFNNTWFEAKCHKHNKNYKLVTKPNENNIDIIVKSKKIQLFLDKDQRYIMKKFIGTYRYFYNRCVSYLNNYNKHTRTTFFHIIPNDNETKIIIELENNEVHFSSITARKYLSLNKPEWIDKQYPSHLIQEAIRECCSKFTTELTKAKQTKTPFVFKYKCKKSVTYTINLAAYMINSRYNGLFSNYIFNERRLFRNLKISEPITKNIVSSSITYHTVLKTFTLNAHYKVDSKPRIKGLKNVAAIDPGIRTPFVIYSPNEVVMIGDNCIDRINKLCLETDIIMSRMNRDTYYTKQNDIKVYYKVNSHKKRMLRKALHRKMRKIKNLRYELHDKTIKFLCDNYRTIILPPFETQQMVSDVNRKIRSKTARNMMTLSFYSFKKKLISKAKEYNINVQIRDEIYTSKTCSNCGKINNNLGGSKVFTCPICKFKIDRDINGACNILLRNLASI